MNKAIMQPTKIIACGSYSGSDVGPSVVGPSVVGPSVVGPCSSSYTRVMIIILHKLNIFLFFHSIILPFVHLLSLWIYNLQQHQKRRDDHIHN